MSPFEIYREANRRLDNLISFDPPPDKSLPAVQLRARDRLADLETFLHRLGNPHRTCPVIHIAGTSGKGSTATVVAAILQAAGLRTLLHTSPYLQVSTEKVQIDGQLIDAATFASLADRVISSQHLFPGRLTYGEAWIALVALAMQEFEPDVAIIEVGAGGRFDLSNVVHPAVAVVTTIGLDHTETLGGTLSDIAWHKAGIIKSGAHVVHAIQEPDSRAQIDGQLTDVEPRSVTVIDPDALKIAPQSGGKLTWRDAESGRRLLSGIHGAPQTLNGALAVAACRAFVPDLAIDIIEAGLRNARIPARLETMPGRPLVVLDGAHNPQKVEALLPDLEHFPRPRIGLIGFLAAKRADEMLAFLLPHLDEVVVTEPNVIGKPSLSPQSAREQIAAIADIPVTAVDSFEEARSGAMALAGSAGSVVVTGSLYLCGAIREHWYPSSEIVRQQSQWPATP